MRSRRPLIMLATGSIVAVAATFAVAMPATADGVQVSNWTSLSSAFATGGSYTLAADISRRNGNRLAVGSGTSVSLDLNGHALRIGNVTANLAGISVPATADTKLTIGDSQGGGTLNVDSGSSAAAIGGDNGKSGGNVTITGGTITAYGGPNTDAAGIGAGRATADARVDGGTLTVTGGNVTAGGNGRAAGVGGSEFGSGATVAVAGGELLAIGAGAAGIGAGPGGENAGSVTVTGGSVSAYGYGGPGIGASGQLASGAAVVVNGGAVYARSGVSEPGIGTSSVSNTQSAGSLQVNGGTVTAVAGPGKAAVGGGAGGTVSVDVAGTLNVSGAYAFGSATTNGGFTSWSNAGQVNVASGTTFVVPSGRTANNTGTLNNDGTLTGYGSLNNAGRFVNNGSTDVSIGGPGSITNTGVLTVRSRLINTGTLTNSGTISGTGTIVNSGTIAGAGAIANNGQGAPGVLVTGNSYLVSYDNNGVAGAAPAPQALFASSYQRGGTVLPTPPTQAGWHFTGWYTSATDGSVVGDTAYLRGLFGSGPKAVTLYAHYAIDQAIDVGANWVTSARVGSTFTASATGGDSGQPVRFSVGSGTTNSACTVDGATVTFVHLGVCQIAADQDGAGFYTPAATATATIAVGKGSNAVNFTSAAPADAAVGSPAYAAAGTGASSAPVVFTRDPATTNDACTVTDSTVTFAHTGTCVVAADQAGDDDHEAATTATQKFEVGKGAQQISVTSTAPNAALPDDTYRPAATAPGGDVTFAVAPASSDVCTIGDGLVTALRTGTCTLTASQAGSDDYLPAPAATQQFDVAAIGSSAALTLDKASTVYGQGATATAAVTADRGTPAGAVQFSLDGTPVGTTRPLVDGSAQSPALLAAPGDHEVEATFTPDDPTRYAGSTKITTLTVGKAATTTAVVASTDRIDATVAVVAPGSGTPQGTVDFTSGSKQLGSVPLADGRASLTNVVPAGLAGTVTATYRGDDNFTGSAGTASRRNPTIRAVVTGSPAPTALGWYRGTVTIKFVCATNGSPLTAPCPATVVLSQSGAKQTVSRTITANDGGVATAAVTVNIDREAPKAAIGGVANGAVYRGSAPAASCVSSDALSGIAACNLSQVPTRNATGQVVNYRVTALDRAGNTTVVSGKYTVLTK